MTTHLESRAQKTKEYTQYIFDEIVKHSPLKPGELIEVRVIEGTTPFPKITEIPVQPDIEGVKSNDIAKQVLGGWFFSSDPGKQIETWVNNKDARHEMKLQELYLYTDKILGKSFSEPLYEINANDPLTITFSFLVMDPEGIRGQMQELGLKIPPKEELKDTKTEHHATFTEMPPQITWEGEIISIPPNSKQFCVCKVAFTKIVGEVVHWDEVAEEIDGQPKEELKTNWHTVYNAVRLINQKIEHRVGRKLFKSTKYSFTRTA